MARPIVADESPRAAAARGLRELDRQLQLLRDKYGTAEAVVRGAHRALERAHRPDRVAQGYARLSVLDARLQAAETIADAHWRTIRELFGPVARADG